MYSEVVAVQLIEPQYRQRYYHARALISLCLTAALVCIGVVSRTTEGQSYRAVCSTSTSTDSQSDSLRELLLSMPNWDHELSKVEWDKVVYGAKVVQSTEDAVVKQVLSQIWFDALEKEKDAVKATMLSLKPFLILRVVFDLPESAPKGAWKNFTTYQGWDKHPIIPGAEKVNLAWPLLWHDGRPVLVTLLPSANGGRGYQGHFEFQYFKDHFKMRDLGHYSPTTSKPADIDEKPRPILPSSEPADAPDKQ